MRKIYRNKALNWVCSILVSLSLMLSGIAPVAALTLDNQQTVANCTTPVGGKTSLATEDFQNVIFNHSEPTDYYFTDKELNTFNLNYSRKQKSCKVLSP